MPKGSPNPQTIASQKYQKKVGYMTKSFKIKREVAERFEKACKAAGVSQAAQITELMLAFAKEQRAAGKQVMLSIMKKNKKFQKEQLSQEGYTEIKEFFK